MSCENKNPLVREGTSILTRVLSALSPGYAKVDERTEADIILFAKRYASYLNYFDSSNVRTGDWEPLMKMDVSVALAELLKIDINKIYDYKNSLYNNIAAAAAVDPDAETKKQFKFLFDLLFSLVTFIDEQYRLIPDDFTQKDVLTGTISSKIAETLANITDLFNKLSNIPFNLIDTSLPNIDLDNAPIPLISCKDYDKTKLNPVWIKSIPLPDSIVNAITIPAKLGSFSEKDQIVFLINHNIFNSQVENLFQGVAFLSTCADELFNQVIEDYPQHTPHYGLFLSFIKIFRYAQDYLNNYTKQHLDFYYKNVLQLTNKDPEPDKAHLLFELQKPVDQHLLEKNILFKAGKDSTGKEISYFLTDDIVLNKSQVSIIHSLQVQHKGKNLLSSPIPNSDDGQGAKLTSADNSWFTFGNTHKAKNAEIGFAIASNILFLNEGERKVTIIVTSANNVNGISNPFPKGNLSGYLTSSKDWQKVNQISAEFISSNQLKLNFTLEPEAPAVVPYSEKIHKENFNIELPILKIYLNQDLPGSIPYTTLSNFEIKSIDISIDVKGIKDLMLSHDNGSIDASKPFKPFGDFPDSGSSFYIGSKEVFQKNLNKIDFNFEWKKIESGDTDEPGDTKLSKPSFPPSIDPDVRYLCQNKWDKSLTLSANSISISPTQSLSKAIDFSKNEKLNTTTLEGFLRLKINDKSYSLATHLSDISAKLSNTTITRNKSTYSIHIDPLPVPNEIILNNFSLNYSASESISLESDAPTDNNLFFHLTPFGYKQVNKRFIDNSSNAEDVKQITILQDIIYKGELFIGFENSEADMVINVLFQVAEGSSNPLEDIEQLYWYYLAGNNTWKKFDSQFIIDRTNNFTQSGIVTTNFTSGY